MPVPSLIRPVTGMGLVTMCPTEAVVLSVAPTGTFQVWSSVSTVLFWNWSRA